MSNNPLLLAAEAVKRELMRRLNEKDISRKFRYVDSTRSFTVHTNLGALATVFVWTNDIRIKTSSTNETVKFCDPDMFKKVVKTVLLLSRDQSKEDPYSHKITANIIESKVRCEASSARYP